MIAKLRARHRVAALALAVVVPTILVAALAVRPDPVVSPAPPTTLADAVNVHAEGLEIDFAVSVAPSSITLAPRGPLLAPSLLVYRSREPAGEGLPSSAEFLGTMAGRSTRRFVLRSPPTTDDELLFYSLGHDRVVGRLRLPEGGAT